MSPEALDKIPFAPSSADYSCFGGGYDASLAPITDPGRRINMRRAATKDAEPRDYVLPRLGRGKVGGLYSTGGVGKSWLALELSILVACGRDIPQLWQDELIPQGKVLYLSLEDAADEIEPRIRSIAKEAEGFSENELDDLVENLRIQDVGGGVWPIRLVGEGEGRSKVSERWVQAITDVGKGCRLIIIDTLRRAWQGDENSSSECELVVSALEKIAKNTQAAVLVLHHTSKAAALNGGGGEFLIGRGSSVLGDHLRWGWTLAGPNADDLEALGCNVRDQIQLAKRQIAVAQDAKLSYGPKSGQRWLWRAKGGVLVRRQEEEIKADIKRSCAASTRKGADEYREGQGKW